MKNIDIVDCKNHVLLEKLDVLEDTFSIILPIEYKNFIMKNNGGHPEKSSYPFLDPSLEEDGEIAWFLAIHDLPASNFIKCYNTYKDRIPKELIPIARNSFGDLICLCISGENYGKVYFWDHDCEAEEGEEPTYDNVYLIANSFTDFINSLYKFDIEEDEDGEEVYVSTHDRYSLPFSTEAKKYGKLVLDFFAQAPSDVEDFIIEQYPGDDEIKLIYDDGKKHERVIYSDGEFEDIE